MSSVLEIRALKWVPLALAAAVALSGCARDGFYHDRNLDYTEAAPAPPLVLPETRNTQRYRDALPVPRPPPRGHGLTKRQKSALRSHWQSVVAWSLSTSSVVKWAIKPG
ncbi:hypothetical protein HORIV_55170 [Vreelandella olivaria]|uniref:Lipoprotein n=1 Tax=Vreelandella olivaria TaxID=390919 RepID=A0ABN5X1T5_9GAMM|nr:hypothetical protein HORIV_55170 [Halomonas olivaria]